MKINSMLQYFVIGFFIYIFWRKKMTVYNEYESCLQNNNDTDKWLIISSLKRLILRRQTCMYLS